MMSLASHEVLAKHPIDPVVSGWQGSLLHPSARAEEQVCALVVSSGRESPWVERAMDQPAHRGPVELAILCVDRRIVPQNFLHHNRVAVERSPMQRRGTVLRQRCYWKSVAEHRADG